VPELSRFLGIVITMFYREHGPPHFHASYGEFDIEVSIGDGVVTGTFPKRALRHVLELVRSAPRRATGELELGRCAQAAQEDRAAGVERW